jgi:hypothetical protein
MMRTFLSLFVPYPIGRLWFSVIGEGVPRPAGVTVHGRIKGHYEIRRELETQPRPAIVARLSDSGAMREAVLINWQASDPCWESPIGCSFEVRLPGLPPGNYTFSLEMMDDLYRTSKGASGNTRILAYYGGPSAAVNAPVPTNPNDAATVSIGPGHPGPHIVIDF